MSDVLADRVVVVTGAAQGLGRAIADGCARAGASVVLADIDGSAVATLAAELCRAGFKGTSLMADVSHEGQVERILEAAHDSFGLVTGLVNSAAIRVTGSVSEHSYQTFLRTLEVNLIGSFLTARAVSEDMKSCGGGSIVNLGSVVGETAREGAAAYCASKGGVAALTRALAADLGEDGVRVNTLIPSFVATPMTTDRLADPAAAERMRAAHVLGRWGSPEEVAACAVFLLSDAASFVTGTSLHVDGGWLAARPL